MPLVALGLLGCFGAHGVGPDGEPRADLGGVVAFDAGSAPVDAGPGDSGPMPVDQAPDAGQRLDLPFDDRCRDATPLGLCPTEIDPGMPVQLEAYIGTCWCETASCDLVDAGDGLVQLRVRACVPGAFCSDCGPPARRLCDLPALAPGPWRIEINGEPALDLEVGADRPVDCTTPAQPAQGSTMPCAWPGTWPPAGEVRVCVPAEAPAQRGFAVEVADVCGGCGDRAGPCEVRIDANRIRVAPRVRRCSCETCDACPVECAEVESACWVPPLAAGDYVVEVEGFDEAVPLMVREEADLDVPDACLDLHP